MPRNDKTDVFKRYDMTGGPDSCWRWSGAVGGRIGEQRPYFQADGRRQLAYRLVYELTHGVSLHPSQSILHSCDNGAMPIGCGNPTHLRIGTVQENSDDMTSRDRHGLPRHVVTAIRRLLEQGRTQQVIADLYGVSRETISAINTKRVHGHVRDTTTEAHTGAQPVNDDGTDTPSA